MIVCLNPKPEQLAKHIPDHNDSFAHTHIVIMGCFDCISVGCTYVSPPTAAAGRLLRLLSDAPAKQIRGYGLEFK